MQPFTATINGSSRGDHQEEARLVSLSLVRRTQDSILVRERKYFDRDIEAQRDGALIVFPEAQSYERSLFWPAWLYRFLP